MLQHLGTQPLETSRLLLRRFEMADAGDIYRNWVTDPEVCRFWTWQPHQNIEETKRLLAGWIQAYASPDYYHWAIVHKGRSQAIGYIYLADIDNANRSVSVHYALSRQYWNQGIMTEACRCVLDFAFCSLGAEKVHSNHHAANPASGRVQQKAGMRHVKTAYKQVPECERLSGDRCYYEITSADWNRAERWTRDKPFQF